VLRIILVTMATLFISTPLDTWVAATCVEYPQSNIVLLCGANAYPVFKKVDLKGAVFLEVLIYSLAIVTLFILLLGHDSHNNNTTLFQTPFGGSFCLLGIKAHVNHFFKGGSNMNKTISILSAVSFILLAHIYEESLVTLLNFWTSHDNLKHLLVNLGLFNVFCLIYLPPHWCLLIYIYRLAPVTFVSYLQLIPNLVIQTISYVTSSILTNSKKKKKITFFF